MSWLVEPLKGIRLLVEVLPDSTCSGTAVLNHCSCFKGLIQCGCSGDMKYAA